MQKGTISVQTENIFPIIKKFLYSDQEIFLRELVSNATDATSKLQTYARKGEFNGDLGELTIDIILDKEGRTLTIKDRGIGMNEEEVKTYLNQVAFSSASEFLEKYKDDTNIIGHFGLGFYSAFMVAERVEVRSLSYKEGSSAVRWVCEGDPSYELYPDDKEDRGTEIILHINDEGIEFLEKERIQSLLDKYCKFLPFPIRFGTRTNTEWEGEGDDRKSKDIEVDNIINDVAPIWKKQPAELTDEDYLSFYKTMHPFGPDPMFWVHLNIDYPFNLTGVLYFPRLNNSMVEMQRNKIALYSNQVYVTDDVKEIVPEFLTLLHGVIDSPDIPLNVSRSYLQSDSNVRKITGYITRKVADRLSELFKEDRAGYEEKWKDLGVFVKYGMISDDKFNDKGKKFVLLKNTEGAHFTMDEYQEKIKETQTNKDGKVVTLYTNNVEDHHAYIEQAKVRGYDVLVLDVLIDNHFMQHLEYKMQGWSFSRVDADTMDNLIKKEEEQTSSLSEEQTESVKVLFKDVTTQADVDAKPMATTDNPVIITRPEFMRRMKEMQSLGGMSMGDMPDMYQVTVNTNHPIIAEKLLTKEGDEQAAFAKYLYDLARLNQGMLKGAELTAFIQRSLSMAQ